MDLTTASKKEMVSREEGVRHPVGRPIQHVHHMTLSVPWCEVNREAHVTKGQNILVINSAETKIKSYH